MRRYQNLLHQSKVQVPFSSPVNLWQAIWASSSRSVRNSQSGEWHAKETLAYQSSLTMMGKNMIFKTRFLLTALLCLKLGKVPDAKLHSSRFSLATSVPHLSGRISYLKSGTKARSHIEIICCGKRIFKTSDLAFSLASTLEAPRRRCPGCNYLGI